MGEICILSGGEFLGIKFQECIDAPPKEERKEDAGWFKKAAAKLEQIVESKKDKSSSHTDYFPRGGGCFTGDAQLLKKGLRGLQWVICGHLG